MVRRIVRMFGNFSAGEAKNRQPGSRAAVSRDKALVARSSPVPGQARDDVWARRGALHASANDLP